MWVPQRSVARVQLKKRTGVWLDSLCLLLSIFSAALCCLGDEFCTTASLCQQCDLSVAGMILKCSDTSFVMFYGYVLCIKSSQ